MHDSHLKETFEAFWATPGHESLDRMKLFKLAWDFLGSDFAGRHIQYERFYAGPPFLVFNHSLRECPWDEFHGRVQELMDSYGVPDSLG